jgi:hypothetical protein
MLPGLIYVIIESVWRGRKFRKPDPLNLIDSYGAYWEIMRALAAPSRRTSSSLLFPSSSLPSNETSFWRSAKNLWSRFTDQVLTPSSCQCCNSFEQRKSIFELLILFIVYVTQLAVHCVDPSWLLAFGIIAESFPSHWQVSRHSGPSDKIQSPHCVHLCLLSGDRHLIAGHGYAVKRKKMPAPRY